MADIIRIDERTAVSGQIVPADIPQIAASGIKLIVNNRPDGEAPDGQPAAADIGAEAARHGITFVDLPFTGATLSADHVAEFAALLKATDDKVLAYCRTGTRSSVLWAAANVALGQPLSAVLAKCAAAGYDHGAAAEIIEALGHSAADMR